MEGPKPSVNSLHSVQYQTAPDQPGDSGAAVSAQQRQRYTPETPVSTPDTPIHERAVRKQNYPAQLTLSGRIKQHSDAYLEHHSQIVTIDNELALANSVPDIRRLLENPAEAEADHPFTILWVPDDGGESVRVIPPGDHMVQQTELAEELKQNLHSQLNTLEAKYLPNKIRELNHKKEEEQILKEHAASELSKLGVDLPELPKPARVTVFGASSIKQSVITKASVVPKEIEHSNIAQRDTPPLTTSVTETSKAIENHQSNVSSTVDGSFQFKHIGAAEKEAPKPHPTENVSQTTDTTSDQLADLKEEAYGEKDYEEKGYEKEARTAIDSSFERSQNTPRIYSDVTHPPLQTSDISIPSQTASDSQNVSFEKIYPTGNTKFVPIFKPKGQSGGNLATVNAGDPGLYVGGGGINRQFGNDLHDRSQHFQNFHQKLWNECLPNNYLWATSDDLNQVPGLEASLMYKPASVRGLTGTVFIDVFKEPWPNNNPGNKAMVYIVPPDGRAMVDADRFKSEVSRTAGDIVQTLHQYNLIAVKSDSQPVITDLRVCGFSSDSFKHAQVTKEEVGACIDDGIRKALKEIQNENSASSHLKKIEYATNKDIHDPGKYDSVFATANMSPVVAEKPLGNFDDLSFTADSLTHQVASNTNSLVDGSGTSSTDSYYSTFETPSQIGTFSPPLRSSFKHLNSHKEKRMTFLENASPLTNPDWLTAPPKHRNKTVEIDALKACAFEPTIMPEDHEANMTKALDAMYGNPPPLDTLFSSGSAPYPRLYSVRKAQLARVLLNFHRKHSLHNNRLREIPDAALPAFELSVLCSSESPSLSRAESLNLAKQYPIPKALNLAIFRARNQSFKPEDSIFATILKDVESLDGMRNRQNFNLAQLTSYSMYDLTAKQELKTICEEYSQLLSEQGELLYGKKSRENPSQHTGLVIHQSLEAPQSNFLLQEHEEFTFSVERSSQYENRQDLVSAALKDISRHKTLSSIYDLRLNR